MRSIIADYIQERQAFCGLFERDCQKRILMFHGESGTGKTTLLHACMENVPPSVPHVHLNCKGSGASISEVFSRTGFCLSWDRFPRFIKQVADLSDAAHVHVDGNQLKGFNNKIDIALKAESAVDRKERRVTLTDAWFEDLGAIDQVFLLSVDTFEQASTETAEWLSGAFLYRAVYTENLRVLISGQNVPDHHEHAHEWGHCSTAFRLVGVREAKHWLPVIQELGYVVPAENPVDFMAGICHALQGRPADIRQVIEGFPRRANTL